jgi:uncharacterized protein (DUF983 family)
MTLPIKSSPAKPPTMTVIRRGLAQRCPACGDGQVLSGYLTLRPNCLSCGIDLSQISADDGPAWATLLVVGHLIAPAMVYVGREESIPIWAAILSLTAATLLAVWWVLPRAKGLFIALIWATGATGEDIDIKAAKDAQPKPPEKQKDA